jgi:hypothetical protein
MHIYSIVRRRAEPSIIAENLLMIKMRRGYTLWASQKNPSSSLEFCARPDARRRRYRTQSSRYLVSELGIVRDRTAPRRAAADAVTWPQLLEGGRLSVTHSTHMIMTVEHGDFWPNFKSKDPPASLQCKQRQIKVPNLPFSRAFGDKTHVSAYVYSILSAKTLTADIYLMSESNCNWMHIHSSAVAPISIYIYIAAASAAASWWMTRCCISIIA